LSISRLKELLVDLLVPMLLKSSARYTSDGASNSSVRGTLDRSSEAVDAIVVKSPVVVVFCVTKKERM
jgi:hypothetical protein